MYEWLHCIYSGTISLSIVGLNYDVYSTFLTFACVLIHQQHKDTVVYQSY